MADLFDRLKATLTERYAIERGLGGKADRDQPVDKGNPVMIYRRVVALLGIAFAVVACNGKTNEAGTFLGESVELGYGTARAFVEFDSTGSPAAIGVTFTTEMLEGLPPMPNRVGRCFDVDASGSVEVQSECVGDYELILPLPEELVTRSDMPFQWVSLNWNPKGHVPPGIYNVPHFDFHFYIVSREDVQQIRPGNCGTLMNCDDLKRALVAVPAQYRPKDYVDAGAALPAMGNHLIDTTSREIASPRQRFTRTFIYGAFDGHITFYEPMMTHAFLMSHPNECIRLKLPEAWEFSGYYPTEYCIRYLESEQEYTVSLEGFVHRETT